MQTLSKLSLFLEGMLAGMFLCSALVEHAESTLQAREWIAYKQAKERVFGPAMPWLFGITLIVAALATFVPYFRAGQAAVVMLLIAALVITVVIHLPLNKAFDEWSSLSFPAHWSNDRRRWRNWNWVRSIFAVAAFLSAVSVTN